MSRARRGEGSRLGMDGGRISHAGAGSVLAATFAANMGVQYLSPVLPSIARNLHLSAFQVGAVVSVYSFAALAMTLPAGFLADRYGARRVLSVSLIIFGVAGVCAGAAPGYGLLLASRVIQGVGFAAIMPVTVAALAGLAPSRQALAHLQAYRVAVSSSAEFVLPLAAGFLVSLSGWRSAFAGFAIPAAVGLLAWRLLPDSGRRPKGGQQGKASYRRQLAESCTSAPVLALFGAGLGRWWLKYALFTYLPLYLSLRLHLGPGLIGTVVAVQGLLSASAASQAGRAGTGPAARLTLVGCMVAMGVSLSVLPVVHALWWSLLAAAVFGVADGLVGPVMNTFISMLPPPDTRTIVIALSATLRNVGKAASPLAVGAILAAVGYGAGFPLAGIFGVAAPAYLWALLSWRESPGGEAGVESEVAGGTVRPAGGDHR